MPRYARMPALATALVLALTLLAPGAHAATAALTPTGLRTGALGQALGIDDPAPTLTWRTTGTGPAAAQTAYQVAVATSANGLAHPDLWDSGTTSATAGRATYGGKTLTSRQRAWWRVRVWDAHGTPSAWSAPAHWETGLLDRTDWSASWIGDGTDGKGTLPLLAKPFTLGGAVRQARLYITALGLYDATLNGRPVSRAVLEPPNTDYRKRAVYSTYDVTRLLRTGANTIGVRLGNGTYNVTGGGDRYSKYVGAQGPPKLLAQLEVTLADGRHVTVGTDGTWRTTPGPTTFAQWYGGEDDDARREPTGWDTPGADLSTWNDAVEAPDPGIALTARGAPPIVPAGTRKTVRITEPEPGTYVFDLGDNVAGRPVLRVRGPAGTTVTMRPGERLRADGTVDQGTMIAGGNRTPPIYDRYTLSGRGTETWYPRFVYHGLRYLQVTGLPGQPDASTVSATILRAGNPSAGTFTSSDRLLDAVHTITGRAVQGNMYSVLTDCPDREKLGWLEETHLVQPTVTTGYDVEAYYRSLFTGMADAQLPSGLIPDIAPEYAVFSGGTRDDPNWGSALILAAWQHYRTYGDTQPLTAHYAAMGRYLDYLTGKSSGHLLDYGLGDWAATDQSTPVGIAATYGYYRSAATLAGIAALLGKDDDAATYRKLAAGIAAAFNNAYANGDTYGSGSQAADAFALDMGVVPANKQAAVRNHLVAAITARHDHLTVGEIALPAVFRVLSAAGRDDVIYRIARQVTAPSYGYQVVHGATALAEYWDGPTGYGSQDHFMLGALDSWFTTGLAGIRQAPGSTGYRDLEIAPAVPGTLTHAAASYRTPRGTVTSAWRRSGRTLRLDVTVPPGAPAQVRMPLPGAVHAPAAAHRTGTGTYAVPAGRATFTVTTRDAAAPDRPQVAAEPPFGTAYPVIAGQDTTRPFRLTNLADHPVTVRPRVTATGGYTATTPARPYTVPAGGHADVPVTVTGNGTAGTLTLRIPGTDDLGGATTPIQATANLARAATLTASSTHSGSDPAWANDGGTDSAVWLNGVGGWNDDTSKTYPDTLTATWPRAVTVGHVRVDTLNSAKYAAAKYGLRDFTIEARDGGTWRTVATVTGNTDGTIDRTFTAVTTTALRLHITDSNDHGYSRVIELQADGGER